MTPINNATGRPIIAVMTTTPSHSYSGMQSQ
jgi:hypothetical protein